jgi:hypothetical protein
MSRCLIALVLVASFPAIALAWGLERTPRRADHRHVESTYKHHRSVESVAKHQRKTGEASDNSFHREYWEPCNSTFREYIVNACDAN